MEKELINSTVITGILSVFVILMLLYIVFSLIEKIYKIDFRYKKRDFFQNSVPSDEAEIIAVISAVHLYNSARDEEETKLTIKYAKKFYSPWSSKAFSVYNSIFYKNK